MRAGKTASRSRAKGRLRNCIAVVAALAGGMSLAAHAGPVRVASINLCTDQLLLALADPQQIASITFLARHSQSSYLANKASGYHLNHGQAEEMVPVDPDVVVASSYLSHAKRRLLEDLGYRVVLFELAASLQEVYENIRKMAALLDLPGRGVELVALMHNRLSAIRVADLEGTAPRALIYEPNGYTGGRQTLRGDILHHARWRNATSDAGIEGVGVLDLEELLMLAPDRLIVSPYAPGTHSLGQRLLEHPAVLKSTSGHPPVNVPIKHWICGGVMNTEAVGILVKHRDRP